MAKRQPSKEPKDQLLAMGAVGHPWAGGGNLYRFPRCLGTGEDKPRCCRVVIRDNGAMEYLCESRKMHRTITTIEEI